MDAKIIKMLSEMGQKLDFIEKKMIENEPNEYLTIKEACQYAKISTTTFHELKKDGLLKVYRLRGKVLLKKHELAAMIDGSLTPNRA